MKKDAETKKIEKEEKKLEKTRSEKELAMINAYRTKVWARVKTPKVKVENEYGKGASIACSEGDKLVTTISLLEAFGTTSLELQSFLAREMIDAACKGDKRKPYEESEVNGVIAAMYGIQPRDELEAMLASQMVATHFAAMRALRQFKNSETIPQQDSNGNMATKLLRTFTAQMEALQRYRGKGQQKMTVEHVHVHPGGQAIVGNVTHAGGGGAAEKTEDQPHAPEETTPAQLENSPCESMCSPALPGEDTKGKPVPVPCHA